MKDRYKFVVELANDAGALVLESKKKHIEVSNKDGDPRNILTNVDIEVNDFITKKIKENFPEELIYSEEADADISEGSFWSIDPIDGTSLFSRNIPHFSVVIAYVEKETALVGAIYNPMTMEMFSFKKGQGAFLNNEPIKVSKIKELKEAVIFLRVGRNKALWEWGTKAYMFLLGHANKTYNFGSSALDISFVGAGRIEAVIYGNLTPIDIVAATGLVQEAGGFIVSKDGESVDVCSKESQPLIIINNKEMLTVLKEGINL